MSSAAEDYRDDAQMRYRLAQNSGRNAYAPAYDELPPVGRYRVVNDIGFGRFDQNRSDNIIHPSVQVTSPYERSMIKRRLMIINKSHD
jgi:hypothetical protein